MRRWQRELNSLTELQQEYLFRLQNVAKLPYELALSHARKATAEEMKTYLLSDYKRCECNNNEDYCKRCEVFYLYGKHISIK